MHEMHFLFLSYTFKIPKLQTDLPYLLDIILEIIQT